MTRTKPVGVALLVLLCLPGAASALDKICDPAYEDCRQPLIDLIDNETAARDASGVPLGGIDVAFWFMEDARYSAALARAAGRGVPIRVLFDSEELDPNNPNLPTRQEIVDQLRSAGIPMIDKTSPGINHWKLMLFKAQNTVEFTGGNFTGEAYVYQAKYADYVDEIIYFTSRQSIVNSFKTAFDDVWTNLQEYADYANITTRTRAYLTYPIDPEMQFHLYFRERSVATYNAEADLAAAGRPTGIDAIIYRITDRAHTDALIAAVKKGVKIRLISEPHQYSDPTRLWHRWNIDRLYMAGIANPIGGEPGVEIRHRAHLGLTHEKLTILKGQHMAVFGSSNWTSASSDYQQEHNMFTTDTDFVTFSQAHFERKWNNTAPGGVLETEPFVPIGPDRPILTSPASGAVGQPVAMTLQWYGGYWAHKYDVYIGTSPGSLVKVLDDEELGPEYQSFNVPGLTGGTTYYWKVVGRTMANLSETSDVWSFTTAGVPSNNSPPVVTLTSPASGASYTSPATIALSASASDSDGTVAQVEFYSGATRLSADTTSPYTATWGNVPAGNYTLTARAIDNQGATTTSSPVSITVVAGTPTPLPNPWAQQDIGTVGAAGNATVSGSTWSVSGSGSDVWGAADEFHYVYSPLTGDGSIIARVATIDNVDQWTKAGVMIRESLTPGSAHAFMIVTPGGVKGLAFQRRTSTGGLSTNTAGGSGTAPAWVKLTRTGNNIVAYQSPDGIAWTPVGNDTIPMAGTVYAGLAVSSHSDGVLATATFDSVAVTAAGGGPPPNVPPSVALTAPSPGATFTAPASIAFSANASDSDGTISRVDFYAGATRVGSDDTSPYSATWSGVAAGTYSLTAHAVDNAGASTVSGAVSVTVSAGPPPPFPAPWAHQDVGAVGAVGGAGLDGSTWTVTGSGADVWGTADQFHYVYQSLAGDGTIVARVVTIDNVDQWTKAGVMIRESLAPGSAHAFMIVTPGGVKGLAFQRRTATDGISTHTSGGAGTAPAWVKLMRMGTSITAYRSNDGAGWTPIASDTIPMAATVLVGLAVSSHSNGVLASATFDNVTVTSSGGGNPPPPANVPPSVTLTSPSAGQTFTAPATITLAADAADSDGTVAQVDFYSGSIHLGSDTTSPYSITWSNVAEGTYHFTARATDNGGAITSSADVQVQVNGTGQPPPDTLPAGWSHGDIGAVGAAGSATATSGTFTIRGSGADIWGTSDGFQFAYRTMTGDGTILARVDSLQAAHDWTKAGVMIRADLTAGSQHAMMVVSAAKGLAFQRRVTPGGLSTHTAGNAGTAPVWVRLQRSGFTITASTSADGVTWNPVGSDTIQMPATVYVGLPITSHADGAIATAVISNVSVSP